MAKENEIERFKKVPLEVPFGDLNPLNVQCNTTKCSEDLHCFRMTAAQIKKKGGEGFCISCGEQKIDLARVRKLDLKDEDFLITSLNLELIRKVYWTTPIPQVEIDNAFDLGKNGLQEAILKRMTDDIGSINPWNNGITPYTGNLIYYAQHATGTCCRRCMEYWFKFPKRDVALTDNQVQYSTDLINLYLSKRVPQLFK